MMQVSGNIMLVSGNILSSAENEERIRCHFQGKQYLGWKAVRDKLKELKEKFENRPPRYGMVHELIYSSRRGHVGLFRTYVLPAWRRLLYQESVLSSDETWCDSRSSVVIWREDIVIVCLVYRSTSTSFLDDTTAA